MLSQKKFMQKLEYLNNKKQSEQEEPITRPPEPHQQGDHDQLRADVKLLKDGMLSLSSKVECSHSTTLRLASLRPDQSRHLLFIHSHPLPTETPMSDPKCGTQIIFLLQINFFRSNRSQQYLHSPNK